MYKARPLPPFGTSAHGFGLSADQWCFDLSSFGAAGYFEHNDRSVCAEWGNYPETLLNRALCL